MHQPAREPNDLERLFVVRANRGDLEGLLALYEPDAVVANGAEVAVGHEQIRELLVAFLAQRPRLSPSEQAPPLVAGDVALTSSRSGGGDVTAEVARLQPGGGWLWVVDNFALCRGVAAGTGGPPAR